MLRPVWLAALLMVVPSALAQDVPPPGAYVRSVDLVERLYLHSDAVTPNEMLLAAAHGLSKRVEWLMVELDQGVVRLRHGKGRSLGEATASTYAQLPAALHSFELAVQGSGYDYGGYDLQLLLIGGMTDALDRYSRVLAGDGLERFDVRLKGTLTGIGVSLERVDEQLVVKKLIDRGPAQRGGVRVGDILMRIDGVATVNMPRKEASRRIRGEVGTPVLLTVQRGGLVEQVALERGEIIVENVHHRLLEGGVGYVKIDHVSQKTVHNLRRSLSSLRGDGGLDRGLVIDLRGNTGGSMKEAARSADQFLEEGLLLKTVGRDGGPVPNLIARIDAVDAGDEAPIPIVVLVDHRSASGAEIIAGALLEHERVALVGTRTYGKGEVQKIYNLDEDSRLKLTVAEYVLAGDRRVAGDGIVPDVSLGRIRLDERGVRYFDWDVERARTAWEDIVPVIDEREGWAGEPSSREDVALELARSAVIAAPGPGRDQVVAALRTLAPEIRRAQEAQLAAALATRGVDWNPASHDGAMPEAFVDLHVRLSHDDPDVHVVTAEVTNNGPTKLYRGLIQLDCASFDSWDGLVIPVGAIESGETASGSVSVELRPGVALRDDEVSVALRADRRPALVLEHEVLTAGSHDLPRFRIEARLVGEGSRRAAEVTVRNLAKETIEGVEVYFQHPRDVPVELVDRAARLPAIDSQGTGSFSLALELGEGAADVLPLNLVIETDGYGRLADWDLVLPLDGSTIAAEAPKVETRAKTRSAPVGAYTLPLAVTDDTSIASVVVYANGQKVMWLEGGKPKLDVKAKLELVAGENHVVATVRDDQGYETRRSFTIRGVMPGGDDAAARSTDD